VSDDFTDKQDRRLLGLAESAIAAAEARGWRRGMERAAKIADKKALEFLSSEYAAGQPLASFSERFACAEVAKAVRAELC
jgi:hypothetical protein